jgi:hypothetical protein
MEYKVDDQHPGVQKLRKSSNRVPITRSKPQVK